MSDQHIYRAIRPLPECDGLNDRQVSKIVAAAATAVPTDPVRAWLDLHGLTAERVQEMHDNETYGPARRWLKKWVEAIRSVQS